MQLEVGQIIEGKVSSITNFGAFIDINNTNKTGMVHISEISYNFVKNIKDALKIGQTLKAKIIRISEKGEIALSIKQLNENVTDKKNTKNFKSKNEKNSGSSKLSNFEWQSPKIKKGTNFEDMMSMFKSASEEKMSDLKRGKEFKRNNGSRRNFQNKSNNY